MILPRFRLRTLMIVVAVTALALGVEVARRRAERRSAEYRARAAQWRRKAGIAASKAFAANHRLKAGWAFDPTGTRRVEDYLRQVEFFRAMQVKYRQAAASPWRPVASDPAEPK
jgi:hypothetical protein